MLMNNGIYNAAWTSLYIFEKNMFKWLYEWLKITPNNDGVIVSRWTYVIVSQSDVSETFIQGKMNDRMLNSYLI